MVTRRTALVGIGGVASGGTLLAVFGTDTSNAQVSFGSLNVQGRDVAESDTLQAVRLVVNATYKFDADKLPDKYVLTLSVGPTEDKQATLDTVKYAPSSKADSGTHELQGNLFTTGYYSPDQFSLGANQSQKELSVVAQLTLEVIRDETVLDSATVTDKPLLTVTKEEINATANVTGTGGFEVSK